MSISEVIRKLEKIKNEHGDIECFINVCDEWRFIDTIKYITKLTDFTNFESENVNEGVVISDYVI